MTDNRIGALLKRADRPKLLIPFFTAGYPNRTTFDKLILSAADSGADIIEIGMPFSDPLADGPEIQHSSFEALKHGVSLRHILERVEKLRPRVDTPFVLMGYYNPVRTFGLERFVKAAHEAGVDGLIIPDLPPDEAAELTGPAKQHKISTVFLVAPTSSDDRIRTVDKASTDFVYAVTVTGVTGSGRTFDSTTEQYLKRLRSRLTKPFVAGFGISSPQSAAQMARYADGVVIGSALIKLIRQAKDNSKAVREIGRFLQSVRKAL